MKQKSQENFYHYLRKYKMVKIMEHIINSIKGAIFDLDGTLIDSMQVWDKVGEDFLLKRGITPPKDFKVAIAEMTFTQSAEYLIKLFNLPMTLIQVIDEWNDMAFYEYSHNIRLKDGVNEFLINLKSNGIKIAIATSCLPKLCETVLKNNGIFDLFDIIVTSDDVTNNKSYPDIYLAVAKKIGISPSDCVVFEDALYAVIGARLAGMRVIGVFERCFANEESKMRTLCDDYILSF